MSEFELSPNDQAMIRHRRRIAHARTEVEQMEVSECLQHAAMTAIFSSPAAFEAFLARNHRRRRLEEVERRLLEMTRERVSPDRGSAAQ